MALRELPGRAAARHRRQRADADRQRAGLLEPRSGLHRHRRPGRRHLLDVPARSPRLRAGLRRTRATRTAGRRLPQRAKGPRSPRRRSPRRRPTCFATRPAAHELPGRIGILERSATDVNAANGCPNCARRRDSLSGWGTPRRREGGRSARASPPAAAGLPRDERRRRHAGAIRVGQDATRSPPRSTTGTIRSTSTRSSSRGTSSSRAAHGGGSGREPQPRALAARDGARRPAGRSTCSRAARRSRPAPRSTCRSARRDAAGTTSRCGIVAGLHAVHAEVLEARLLVLEQLVVG